MIPKPVSFVTNDESFDFARPLFIQLSGADSEGLLAETSALFADELQGLGLSVLREASGQGVRIELSLEPELGGGLRPGGAANGLEKEGSAEHLPADESFLVEIAANSLKIRAAAPVGIFYGTRTVLAAAAGEGRIACGELKDAPRYSWRGMHLDVARHFYPVSAVKRFIDLLALHKMNVFHWHLTEDQGWRIQIDAFPELTEVSAWREQDGERYGGYYTKDEVREVLSYAKKRFISVVPEIEMPGHAVAALAAYPELSCNGGPFEVETNWGIFDDVYCAGNEKTFEFLETVLDEVIELFPSQFFHIGGDECPKTHWKTCPKCQARMQAEGLKSEEELQSWFISRMSRYLSEKGRRLVGWDEILEGGLAPGATVMSWRGTEGGIRAAQMGHDVVMSPTDHCYLDYRQVDDEEEPGAWFGPTLDLETVYSYEPTPSELTRAQAVHVLGVQGNIWSEKMPTFKHVEYMTFPRMCALAEVAWGPAERNFSEFQERLQDHCRVLDRWNVGYKGSSQAEPVLPTSEDKKRYAQARAERKKEAQVAAY